MPSEGASRGHQGSSQDQIVTSPRILNGHACLIPRKRQFWGMLVVLAMLTILLISTADRISWHTYIGWSMTATESNLRTEPLTIQLDAPTPVCFTLAAEDTTIGNITNMLRKWATSSRPDCRNLYRRFTRLFDVRSRNGRLAWKKSFEGKMVRWLGNNLRAATEARTQTVIFTRNRWTSEASIFNPLRQKRPKPKGGNMTDREFIERLIKKEGKVCDFCNYSRSTAFDTFGRIESKYSVTVANAFKLDAWHSLVVFRGHHPLNWGLTELKDVFNVARQWYARVHASSPRFVYPMISWDLLPHSGSSQIHPHIHCYLTPDGYYGYLRQWHTATEDYAKRTGGANYYSDMISAHRTLGLSVSHGSAIAIASLTPRKDNEIVILSKEFDESFTELMFHVLRAYIDLGSFSFSMAISLPPLTKNLTGMPAIARMVTRGSSQDSRSDVTSMELFAAANIDTDVFKFARILRQSVERRTKESKSTEGLNDLNMPRSSPKTISTISTPTISRLKGDRWKKRHRGTTVRQVEKTPQLEKWHESYIQTNVFKKMFF